VRRLALASVIPEVRLFLIECVSASNYRPSQDYTVAGTVPNLATPSINTRPGTPTTERVALGGIFVASAAAVAFLLWLLYLHHPAPALARQWIFLPQLNALLNGLSAIALCVGLYFIKHKKWRAHRVCMLSAFGFSSLFLVSYIANHALRGDTPFPGVGTTRTVYLSILASHVLCSIVALPMVLTTLLFALRGQFKAHRRLARVTFPIWLYVSVTGVVVFVFLKAYAY
jgi:putative membrane protein